MYTQCPQCNTIFAVSDAQLKARAGLVRCGQCRGVFRADQYMFDTLPQAQVKPPESPVLSAQSTVSDQTPNTTLKPKKSAPRKRADHYQEKASEHSIPVMTPLPNAGLPRAESTKTPLAAKKSPVRRPTNAADSRLKPTQKQEAPMPAPRSLAWLWGIASMVLVGAFCTQLIYFNSSELALTPDLAPWITRFCQTTGCVIRPRQDVSRIELVEAGITPHPQFEKMLEVKATLVNRAGFTQAYPSLEVTLSNNDGVVIARRAFHPQEYLEKPSLASEGMPPNIAINALFAITEPGKSSVGYEIQLLNPQP